MAIDYSWKDICIVIYFMPTPQVLVSGYKCIMTFRNADEYQTSKWTFAFA